MKFSENWLRTWVNPDLSSDALAHTLTMAGLEVEALEAVAPAFNEVVIAEVLSLQKHPDADRLNVCQVNVGETEPLTIVCGAKNVAVGLKVPCARIGAVLPGDFKIKKAKVRGVESSGMLCSEQELGLAESADGLWILPVDAPVGQSLRQYYDLDDKLFTLKLTPNRSDCSGLLGVAREVAALTACDMTELAVPVGEVSLATSLSVRVLDQAACPLYCGRSINGVNAAAVTPNWIKQRLERSGLRTINAVVDITNYVMLELGQPMHAFDASQLNGGIVVRPAQVDETLTLLNGQQVTLDQQVLVIADQQRLLAMAGVMGGENSGVETSTQDIFLESAFFHPDAIAGRARRFGLATDSSFRFERGVDFGNARLALERASQLVLEICGGQLGPVVEVRGDLPTRSPIVLRPARVQRVVGVGFDQTQIAELLQRLQFEYTQLDDGNFEVVPPSYRFDLEIEVDLIEELVRLYGYDNVPAQAPQSDLLMLPTREATRCLSTIQQRLLARDYQEIISYAFVDEKTEARLCANQNMVRLQNPIASNLAVMRSSLIGGLVGALSFNLNRKQSRVRLFEVGACFAQQDGNYTQRDYLAGLAYGPVCEEQWGSGARMVDFYDVKADVEALFAPANITLIAEAHPALHPGRSARIWCQSRAVGWIGELHPEHQQAYDFAKAPIWFEVELAALSEVQVPRMSAIPKSLPARRDLALVVDETVTVQALLDAMNQAKVPYVSEIALFDVYRGQGVATGKKSLAFRVLMQDTEKTLTDSEIEPGINSLVESVQGLGAQLRI